MNTFLPAQENEIWGVWNSGQISNNIQNIITNDGTFVWDRNGFFLIFESNFFGRGPQILYEGGGSYRIKRIISNTEDTISFYIEELQPDFESGWMTVNAKIVVHFIDEDKIWIEIDYNDPEYPTTQGFNPVFFRGRAVVYWRQRICS